MMALNKYQEKLRSRLEKKLGTKTLCEWRAQMNAKIYSPRIDVATGPFSVVDGVRLIEEYNELMSANSDFISELATLHLTNLHYINESTTDDEKAMMVQEKMNELYHFNFNSRCFLAIEIENAVTRKHLMGGAINASVLGRIGIAVGYTDEMHNAFLNLYRYFSFLQSVDKPTFRTNNLLIISAEQLMNVLVKRNRYR